MIRKVRYTGRRLGLQRCESRRVLSATSAFSSIDWDALDESRHNEVVPLDVAADFSDLAAAVAGRAGVAPGSFVGASADFIAAAPGSGWTTLDTSSTVVTWSQDDLPDAVVRDAALHVAAHGIVANGLPLTFDVTGWARTESIAEGDRYSGFTESFNAFPDLSQTLSGFATDTIDSPIDPSPFVDLRDQSFTPLAADEVTPGWVVLDFSFSDPTGAERPAGSGAEVTTSVPSDYQAKRDRAEQYVGLTGFDSTIPADELSRFAQVVETLVDSESGVEAEEAVKQLIVDRLFNSANLEAAGAFDHLFGVAPVATTGEADDWAEPEFAWSADSLVFGSPIAQAAETIALFAHADARQETSAGAGRRTSELQPREAARLGESPEETSGKKNAASIGRGELPATVLGRRAGPAERTQVPAAFRSQPASGMIDLAALLRAEDAPSVSLAEVPNAARDAAFALESWRRATPIRALGPSAPRDAVGPNPTIYTDAEPGRVAPARAEVIDPSTAGVDRPATGTAAWLATAFLGGAVLFVTRRMKPSQAPNPKPALEHSHS